MKRNKLIAAAAIAAAGAAAYFIRKKRATGSRLSITEPASAEIITGQGRKGTKHKTEAFSRAKNQGGKPSADENDII